MSCLNEKEKEAVNLLSLTRKLCAKKSEIKKVNAAIVYYAESSEVESLKEHGQKAAVKLISLRLSVKEKGELASSLENLGFATMANNLDKEIDKALNRAMSDPYPSADATLKYVYSEEK